jgi:hypothetical protein
MMERVETKITYFHAILLAGLCFVFTNCGSVYTDFVDPEFSGIKINKSSLSLAVGAHAQLTATEYPSDPANKPLVWESSAAAVAAVTSPGGLVSAVAGGVAVITVKTLDAKKSATCTVTVTETVPVPSAPGTVTVTPGNGQLALSWAAVSGATEYEVWYNTTDNSATATMKAGDITGVTLVTFTIFGLTNGVTYCVWVKAKNSAGTSGFSVYVSGTPNLPVFAVGDTGPGGGIVFYISGGGTHGLEAASGDIGNVTWSNIDVTAAGSLAQNTAIGTGMNNCNAIIGQAGHTTSAAKLCRDYTGGGKTDWFLPSKDELNELYINRTIVGAFSASAYWSSSEDTVNSSVNAWGQNFGSGNTYIYVKSSLAFVRPVRAF